MTIAYFVVTGVFAAMVLFSGIGKIRRDPKIVKVIHEIVGVPMKYFPLLAACEFAGAVASSPESGGRRWALPRAWDWSATSLERRYRTCEWEISKESGRPHSCLSLPSQR